MIKFYIINGYFLHQTPQFVEKNDYKTLISIIYDKEIPKSTKVLAINMGPFSFGYQTKIFEHMTKNFEEQYLKGTPESIKNLNVLSDRKEISLQNFPLYIGWYWKTPEFLELLKRGK